MPLSEINVWVSPLTALLGTVVGTVLGAWLLDHYSGQRWLRQQQWAAREKHYMELVSELTRAKTNLTGQSEYYMEPGSEYRDYTNDERFGRLGKAAAAALHAVQELAGPASVFLSQKAVAALQELVREEWHAAFDAAHPGEYIEKALSLVNTARAIVVAEAKSELTLSTR